MTELQRKLLDLVGEIDQICRKNDISYYLVGGSLIGALRHKGFVPWDDDLDVIMTRDNWERFLKVAQKDLPKGIELHCTELDDNSSNTVNHFEDMETTAIYRFNVPSFERSGVLIDILILDPVPDDEHAKQLYVEKLTQYADLINLAYWYSIRVGHSLEFEKNYKKMKQIGRDRMLDELSKEIFHYKDEECSLYAQRLAGAPHFWPKEVFGTPKYVPFEDTMLPVPERAEDCLCIGYDDEWMYVPQGGVTKSVHDFCVMNLNLPSKYIMDEFKSRVNPEQLESDYVQKKILQDSQTVDRYQLAYDNDLFLAEKTKLIYQQKSAQTDVSRLLQDRNYPALELYFEEYTKAQCNSRFLGSSALAGWINWERKHHPLLIDIGDDALIAALHLYMYQKHLTWVGRLLKARRAIDRPFTPALEEMEAQYDAVKKARSHLGCKEYDACREILDQLEPQYPDNPFFCIMRLELESAQGNMSEDLFSRMNEYLKRFPSDPELLVQKGNALEAMSKTDEAFQLYASLIPNTTQGFVLQNIRERIEKRIAAAPSEELYRLWLEVRAKQGEENLPTLESLCAVESSETKEDSVKEDGELEVLEDPVLCKRTEELTAVQQRRLDLLIEIAQLCEQNHIRYYLFDRTLWQAARCQQYVDVNGDLTIAMTPENCKKFIEAFSREGRTDRYLDSMEQSASFDRFCLRYGDENSLDFTISRCGTYGKCGIYVTIEILRQISKSNLRNRIDRMLEMGWESIQQVNNQTTKQRISGTFVAALSTVFGKKRIAKWLYTRFMNGPKNKVVSKYFLKRFGGKRVYYPAYFFQYSGTIMLEGHSFQTMKLYENYLNKAFGVNWASKPIPPTNINTFTRFADEKIPYQQYLEFLAQEQIDVAAIWKRRRQSDRKYAPVNKLHSATRKYWDLMCACGERYRLWQQLMPKRTYLIELYRSNDVEKLMEELQDYYNTAMACCKKGYGLCFDRKIFEIMEYALYATGKVKQAQRLRGVMSPKDWQPIAYDLVKPGGGYGMRLATQNDVPAILTYLKRHVTDCIYMYIDIKKYGIDHPNMTVWMDSNEQGVQCVVMKYYTSLSIFSDNEQWDAEQIAKIALDEKVLSIHGPKRMVEVLAKHFPDNIEIEYGDVYEFTNDRQYEIDKEIELATTEDALEIAKLVVTDEGIGAHYEVENLAAQFKERMETQMGRSFVIRDQGKIIAHIASYAEFDGISTTSGLIVDHKYRNNIYGTALEAHLIQSLKKDGFRVYTFVITRLRRKLLAALGNQKVAEYGKMILRSNNDC